MSEPADADVDDALSDEVVDDIAGVDDAPPIRDGAPADSIWSSPLFGLASLAAQPAVTSDMRVQAKKNVLFEAKMLILCVQGSTAGIAAFVRSS